MTYQDFNVPAASLQRSFGMWREQAAKGPVYITHHGRPSHVLMSHDHYLGLMGPDAKSSSEDDLSVSKKNILEDIDQGVLIVDNRSRVIYVNRIYCEHVGMTSDQLVDRQLREIFPALTGSIFMRHIEAALRFAKRSTLRGRSVLRNDCWLCVDAFPVPAGAAVLLRNISEEVVNERRTLIRQAMEQALDLHDQTALVILSPRGGLERTNAAFASLIGATQQSLADASIFDVIAVRRRPDFRHDFERAFRDFAPVRISSALLARDGGETPVEVAIVPVQGEFAVEGAVGVIVAA